MSSDASLPPVMPPIPAEQSAAASAAPRVITSEQLLGGAREIVIHHAGRPYRLCLTSRNKLILVA
jgi:hemin uptake protein HemP